MFSEHQTYIITSTMSSIVKSVSIIVVFTIIFKILGFCREFFLSYFWGTSGVSDAFLISQTIPGTLFQFVGVGLTTCFIPVYYLIEKKEGLAQANVFTNKLTTIILFFSTILITAVWIDTPLFVKIFASGFSDQTLSLACDFTRIGILSLYFSTFAFVYESYLQAHRRFVPGAASSVLQSILVLIALYLGAVYNIWILPVGCAMAIGVRVLVMTPSVKKTGLKYRPNFRWKDEHVSYFFKLLLPVVIGVAVNDLNVIFDRTIASQVTIGAISALTYASSLVQLVNGGLVQPVSTVYYPYITNYISSGNIENASLMLKKALSVLLSLLLPITALFMIYSKQIVMLLFGRGAFDDRSVSMTSGALVFYVVGLSFIGIQDLLSKYYYASGNTKSPMYYAAIGVVFNISLNIVLSKIMGVSGLALATSSASFIISVLLMYNVKKNLQLNIRDIVDYKEVRKIIIASVIMALLSYMISVSVTYFGHLICLLICAPLSILMYVGLAYLFKMEIISAGREVLKRMCNGVVGR